MLPEGWDGPRVVAVGLSEHEVRTIKLTPAWWGRSLHCAKTLAQEPIGVVLAMQSTQEGQQPALNTEVVLLSCLGRKVTALPL
jgi:hypothetical protein